MICEFNASDLMNTGSFCLKSSEVFAFSGHVSASTILAIIKTIVDKFQVDVMACIN